MSLGPFSLRWTGKAKLAGAPVTSSDLIKHQELSPMRAFQTLNSTPARLYSSGLSIHETDDVAFGGFLRLY